MRPVHILIFVATMLTACKSEKNNPALLVKADSLLGNWVVINVKSASDNKKYQSLMQSVITPLQDKIELAIFNFRPAGALTIDEGKIENINGNWLYNDKKELIIGNVGLSNKRDLPFTVTGYQHDSLIIENIIGEGKDQLHIKYTLKKLKPADSIPDLFAAANNHWRERSPKAEDDQAIKLRLKQALTYYSAYFALFKNNKVPFFNTEKIICPILFYSGGIGLKKFHISDEWTKLFYDNRDAEKAHAMLDKAFAAIKDYPDQGDDYVAEYVIALKMVADKL